MSAPSPTLLGIDPGRDKTGLAVIDATGAILWRAVVETSRLPVELAPVLASWKVARIALGNSTSSQNARAQIESVSAGLPIELVNERNSTLEARALYFEAHPPRGWRRLCPLSLQVPPVSIDDFAAAIIARRALESGLQRLKEPEA